MDVKLRHLYEIAVITELTAAPTQSSTDRGKESGSTIWLQPEVQQVGRQFYQNSCWNPTPTSWDFPTDHGDNIWTASASAANSVSGQSWCVENAPSVSQFTSEESTSSWETDAWSKESLASQGIFGDPNYPQNDVTCDPNQPYCEFFGPESGIGSITVMSGPIVPLDFEDDDVNFITGPINPDDFLKTDSAVPHAAVVNQDIVTQDSHFEHILASVAQDLTFLEVIPSEITSWQDPTSKYGDTVETNQIFSNDYQNVDIGGSHREFYLHQHNRPSWSGVCETSSTVQFGTDHRGDLVADSGLVSRSSSLMSLTATSSDISEDNLADMESGESITHQRVKMLKHKLNSSSTRGKHDNRHNVSTTSSQAKLQPRAPALDTSILSKQAPGSYSSTSGCSESLAGGSSSSDSEADLPSHMTSCDFAKWSRMKCASLNTTPTTAHPTQSTFHPTPSTAHFTPSTFNPTPSTAHLTQPTFHPTPSTFHPTPSTVHPTPSTVHPTPSSFHPTPSTFHATPYSFHVTSSSFHTTPSTFHPTPSSFHATPSSFHPTPSTFHPTPSSFHATPSSFHPTPSSFHTTPSSFHTTPSTFHPTPSAFHRAEAPNSSVWKPVGSYYQNSHMGVDSSFASLPYMDHNPHNGYSFWDSGFENTGHMTQLWDTSNNATHSFTCTSFNESTQPMEQPPYYIYPSCDSSTNCYANDNGISSALEESSPYNCCLNHGNEFFPIQHLAVSKMPRAYQSWKNLTTILEISFRVVKLRVRKQFKVSQQEEGASACKSLGASDDDSEEPLLEHYGTGFACHIDKDTIVIRTHSELVGSALEASNTEVVFVMTFPNGSPNHEITCTGVSDGFSSNDYSQTTKFVCRTPPDLIFYLHLFKDVPIVRQNSLFNDSCYFTDSSPDTSASGPDELENERKDTILRKDKENINGVALDVDVTMETSIPLRCVTRLGNASCLYSHVLANGSEESARQTSKQSSYVERDDESVRKATEKSSNIEDNEGSDIKTTEKSNYIDGHEGSISQATVKSSNDIDGNEESIRQTTEKSGYETGYSLKNIPTERLQKYDYPTSERPHAEVNVNTPADHEHKSCGSFINTVRNTFFSPTVLPDDTIVINRTRVSPGQAYHTRTDPSVDNLHTRIPDYPWPSYDHTVPDLSNGSELLYLQQAVSMPSPLVIMERRSEVLNAASGTQYCPYADQSVFGSFGAYTNFSSFAGDIFSSWATSITSNRSAWETEESADTPKWEYEKLLFLQSHHRDSYRLQIAATPGNPQNDSPDASSQVANNDPAKLSADESISITRKDGLENTKLANDETDEANSSGSSARCVGLEKSAVKIDSSMGNPQQAGEPHTVNPQCKISYLLKESSCNSASTSGSKRDVLAEFSTISDYLDTWDRDLLGLDNDLSPMIGPDFIETMIKNLLEDSDQEDTNLPVCCPQNDSKRSSDGPRASDGPSSVCLIISYPHGGPKMVSTGSFSRHYHVGGILYDTPTCMGSCGAPVVALVENMETPYLTHFVHSGTIKVNSVPVGAGVACLD